MAKGKQVSKVIVYVLLLLLLAGLVYAAVYFLKDKDIPIIGENSFYIEYGGKKIADKQSVELPLGKEARFDCKTILGGTADYTVTVEPYLTGKNNFEFSVDERLYIFSGIKADLSAAFNVTKADGHFTIKVDSDIIGILKTVYPQSDITVADLDYSAAEYFAIIVKPSGGSAITIPFKSNMNLGVQGVELDQEEILL